MKITAKKVKKIPKWDPDRRDRMSITKHGMTQTSEYDTWIDMKMRCSKPHHHAWKDYGARGITVCDRWLHDFEAFYADMGPRPTGKQLERIDNDKGYGPSNCCWATCKEQNNNRRDNTFLTHAGKTQTAKQWSEELNISYSTLITRLCRGWNVEDALTRPIGKYQKKEVCH